MRDQELRNYIRGCIVTLVINNRSECVEEIFDILQYDYEDNIKRAMIIGSLDKYQPRDLFNANKTIVADKVVSYFNKQSDVRKWFRSIKIEEAEE